MDKRDNYPTLASGRRLNVTGFFGQMTPLFDGLTGTLYKVETRQTYQEPGNPSWEALDQGDFDRALELVPEFKLADEEAFYSKFREAGIDFTRIRLVKEPLTDYTRWEFECYKLAEQYGEKVRIVDVSDPEVEARWKQISDFMIFDDHTVAAHDYDDNGLIQGGWIFSEERAVDRYSKIWQELIKGSIPFSEYLK